MGLSASQGRLLLLTERKSDLEFRAQQISQQRLVLSQQLESISKEYEAATSNRQMMMSVRGSDGQTYTLNLTYALLISGTVAGGNIGGVAGIQGTQYTKTKEGFEATSKYRLVTPDGAIVVGSKSEIPNSVSYRQEDEPKTITNTDLGKLYKDSDVSARNLSYAKVQDGDNTVDAIKISYKDKNNNEKSAIYRTDGSLISDNADVIETESGDYGTSYSISVSTGNVVTLKHSYLKTDVYYNNETDIEPDDSGVYTVGLSRYIVDPLLLKGGTGASAPNYLQDCLRNGKYLVQKGDVDTDENEFKWKNLSWDSVSAISDRYYTDDDNTAKAKYDRLQAEIQNQDKKLELELDNIETQRSAVTTEIESVQKVIDDNIQSSFKTFNA